MNSGLTFRSKYLILTYIFYTFHTQQDQAVNTNGYHKAGTASRRLLPLLSAPEMPRVSPWLRHEAWQGSERHICFSVFLIRAPRITFASRAEEAQAM